MKNSPLIQDIPLFLDDKPAVYALRQNAKETLLNSGFPTTKNENWKYTNIRKLVDSAYSVDTSEKICGHDCCCSHEKNNSVIEIKFCHGKLHIEEYNTPAGLSIIPMPLALYENKYKPYLFHSYNLEEHPFAALNGMYLEQGICIYLEKNTHISTPIHFKYNQNDCAGLQINLHNLVILEKNSSLELIEEFSAETADYLTNVVNEIYLKPEAQLSHYKIQKESLSAHHIALNGVKVAKDAIYTQFYAAHGGKLSRQETVIDLMQMGASANVYSAYTAKKNSVTDITTNIYHNHPQTRSNQIAKAVLEDSSTAVFQGSIYIAKDAVKTEGYQLHKALYTDDNAELYCKPQLQIFADDVKCSHGSSCGDIDKEQLFYLTSRGISSADAKKILIDAHLDEISALIKNEQIRSIFQMR